MTRAPRRVLIVDDNEDNLVLLTRRLEKRGFICIPAHSGPQALSILQTSEKPDIILLDVTMPQMNGLELVKILRAEESPYKNVPIIMVSAVDETGIVVEALRLGANDYVTKPLNFEILLARLETQLRIRDALETITAQRDMMASLALLDPLTGVYNRRALEARLDDELTRSRRYQRPLSLLFADLDHFKRVNDTYGHLIGDEVLKWFAKTLQESLRAADVVGRYGGEEFCAILPEATASQARNVAERICRVVSENPVEVRELAIPITVSIGVAEAQGEMDARTLIHQADVALYSAKKAGRKCVKVYSKELEIQPENNLHAK